MSVLAPEWIKSVLGVKSEESQSGSLSLQGMHSSGVSPIRRITRSLASKTTWQVRMSTISVQLYWKAASSEVSFMCSRTAARSESASMPSRSSIEYGKQSKRIFPVIAEMLSITTGFAISWIST
ncbi:Hypothetical_protein [Hexamita inflata]|uniref:Hypothetical_protein n=1 Tax=Hexamita inflata TaxID=28002 RepID=A0ABP1KHS0_9EUKA